MSALPEGLSNERVFVIIGQYSADAAERRVAVRGEHLARVGDGLRDGRVLLAGGYEDMSASILILRVEAEAEARAWADTDVYVRSGVWTSVDVRPMAAVVLDGGRA